MVRIPALCFVWSALSEWDYFDFPRGQGRRVDRTGVVDDGDMLCDHLGVTIASSWVR